MRKKIRGVIFDMDGTLIDTERLYQKMWNMLAEERGYSMTEEMLRKMRGARADFSTRLFEAVNPGFSFSEEKELCIRRAWDWCEIHGVPAKQGAEALLRELKREGYRCAIGSSSTQEQIRYYMDRLRLTDCFDFIGSGDMVEQGKPAPDLFLLCAERLGLSPEETLVVEDSVNGVLAGRNAGAWVAAVQDVCDLAPAIGAMDVTLSTLEEVLPWIREKEAEGEEEI